MSKIVEADHADIVEANQSYGALTEGFYIAGFTFERAMGRVLSLLKDGGWRQVGAGFDDVNDFVRSLDLHQFKVLAEQRQEFTTRVKALQLEVSNRAIAEALGVSHDTVNRDAGRNRPPDDRNAQQNGEGPGRNRPPGASDGRRDAAIIINRDTREERREEKLAEIARANRALPAGVRYPVVYADPPWRYEHPPMGGNRVVENHYPTMPLEDICALRVGELAADDAVLYLWATAPRVMKAGRVIEAWASTTERRSSGSKTRSAWATMLAPSTRFSWSPAAANCLRPRNRTAFQASSPPIGPSTASSPQSSMN